jgi:hypothetical protein
VRNESKDPNSTRLKDVRANCAKKFGVVAYDWIGAKNGLDRHTNC